MSDAGWSTFRGCLEYFGQKYGKVTVAVPPHYRSQNCSNCGNKVQKSLSVRTHICPHCGFPADRDVNASSSPHRQRVFLQANCNRPRWRPADF
ncbi:MAG: transposase [Microcoleus sp.]